MLVTLIIDHIYACTSAMLSRNILNWLVLLLTLATVTMSKEYYVVPVDSTDLCHDYLNGTCFTLEQLVQTDLLSGGDNLTLSFLPGDHMLSEQLWIRNFLHVHITSQSTSTCKAVIRFHSNGAILFVSSIELNVERLSFIGANIFIASTQIATIERTVFMNNTGRALHIEADDVYITNSEFTRNDGGAVYIESNKALINNTEFNYNSAENGGAVEVVSGAVVITWCTFTNNKASRRGGAISAENSGSVTIS